MSKATSFGLPLGLLLLLTACATQAPPQYVASDDERCLSAGERHSPAYMQCRDMLFRQKEIDLREKENALETMRVLTGR